MKFIVAKEKNEVKLTLDERKNCVVLKANGHALMTFSKGEYCLNTDAGEAGVVGIMFDKSKIVHSKRYLKRD